MKIRAKQQKTKRNRLFSVIAIFVIVMTITVPSFVLADESLSPNADTSNEILSSIVTTSDSDDSDVTTSDNKNTSNESNTANIEKNEDALSEGNDSNNSEGNDIKNLDNTLSENIPISNYGSNSALETGCGNDSDQDNAGNPSKKFSVTFYSDASESKEVLVCIELEEGSLIPPFELVFTEEMKTAYFEKHGRLPFGEAIPLWYDIEVEGSPAIIFGEDKLYKNLFLFPKLSGGTPPPPPPIDGTNPGPGEDPIVDDPPKPTGGENPKPTDTTIGNPNNSNIENPSTGTINSNSNNTNRGNRTSGLNSSEEAVVGDLGTPQGTSSLSPIPVPLSPANIAAIPRILPPLKSGEVLSAFNFVLSSATIALTLLLFFTYFSNKRSQSRNVKKHGVLRLLSIVPSLLSLIILVPTQDFDKPLHMADSYTVYFAIILLVQLVITIMARKSYSYDDIEEIL